MSDELRDHVDEDTLLALASAEIRREHMPQEAVEAAAARVWERLEKASAEAMPAAEAAGDGRLRGCADLQALIPAYRSGDLKPERALLLEDHARECIPCRRALQAAGAGHAASAGEVPRLRLGVSLAGPWLRRAGLAAMVAAALVGAYAALRLTVLAPAAPTATVERVDGALFQVSGDTAAPLLRGAAVRASQSVRTAKGGGAVLRLGDGSRVELRERSEIALERRADGAAIVLARGDILVQAATQAPGRHLYVATDDCLVSVVGTIFAVEHGTKGSRVAVLQGEVRVAQGRRSSVLRPGDQMATQASLEAVPLVEQVAWSRDADRYVRLVRELRGLGHELESVVDRHGLRTSTALLDLVPATTAVYAAVPNVSDSLGQAYALLQQRVEQSDVLRQWWQESMVATGADQRLRTAVEHLRDFGGFVGEEVVLAVAADPATGQPGRRCDDVLILTEIARAAGLDAFLAQEVERLNAEAKNGRARLIVDPSHDTQAADARELLIWHDSGVLAASPSLDRLRALQQLRQGAANPFLQTSFHARLADAYSRGTGWLLAVDLETLLAERRAAGRAPASGEARSRVALEQSGFQGVRTLMFERPQGGPEAENRAELSFAGPRRGIASWLAAPAPMGSLDFVTPEANAYAGFVVKSPAAMVDDLLAIADATNPGAAERLHQFEQREGIQVRADLAAPLGGEVAFALDGPMLPNPSWKLIVEVYDQARLQATIEQLLERANAEAVAAGKPPGRLETSQSGGHTFYTLTFPGTGLQASYTFADGYLVAAPSIALLQTALQAKAAGATLAGATRFTDLLPHDGHANFSALLFQDLGATLQPLIGLLGPQNLTPTQRQALSEAGKDARPTLAYAYGEEDKITAAVRGGGPFGLDLGWLLRLGAASGRFHDQPPAGAPVAGARPADAARAPAA